MCAHSQSFASWCAWSRWKMLKRALDQALELPDDTEITSAEDDDERD
jgi:hypothetical protein